MPRRPAPAPIRAPRADPASLSALLAFGLAWTLAACAGGAPRWAAAWYALASLLCALAYAIDKSAARARRERVPEAWLLWLGALGGWPGALVAQQLWRHKTVKRRFRRRFWATVAANAAVVIGLAAQRHWSAAAIAN